VTRDIFFLFLRKELRDVRSNKQVWPAYLLLPALAIALPVLLLVLSPTLTDPASTSRDAAVDFLIRAVEHDPSLTGATLQEKVARLLVRDLGVFSLLIGVILASSAAALALVREKEQRTLEPILATPLRDRELLLAKLFAATGPALLVAWGSALLGSIAALVVGFWRPGVLLLPTAGNLVAWALLTPALAVFAGLVALRASARFTDVPGATQFTGLVVVPLSLILVAVLGRPAMSRPLVGLGGAVAVGLLSLGVFRGNLRRFRREEILTKWR